MIPARPHWAKPRAYELLALELRALELRTFDIKWTARRCAERLSRVFTCTKLCIFLCTESRTLSTKRTSDGLPPKVRCACHSFRDSAFTHVVAFLSASFCSRLSTGPGTQPRSLHSHE